MTGREGGTAALTLTTLGTISAFLPKKDLITPLFGPGAPTNIYIQGLDTVTQLSTEIRVLKEENLGLQSRIQANTGASHESQLRFP